MVKLMNSDCMQRNVEVKDGWVADDKANNDIKQTVMQGSLEKQKSRLVIASNKYMSCTPTSTDWI